MLTKKIEKNGGLKMKRMDWLHSTQKKKKEALKLQINFKFLNRHMLYSNFLVTEDNFQLLN